MGKPTLGLYLNMWERTATWPEVVDVAVAAEQSGFSHLAVPEAFGRDGFTLCDRLLARTARAQVGLIVANVFSRSPAVLAQTAATLDELSGGRFVLGLGASTANLVEDWHGLEFARAGQRIVETVAICRQIWRRQADERPGPVFRGGRVRLGFEPLRADIPIWLGSVSTRGIAQAGAIADGWVPFLLPRESLGRHVKELRRAGEGTGATRVVPIIPVAADADADRRLREIIGIYVGPPGSPYARRLAAEGHDDAVEAMAAAYRSGGGRAAGAVVPDELVDALALSGPLDAIGEKIDRLAEAGADTVMLWPVGVSVERCARLFATVAG